MLSKIWQEPAWKTFWFLLALYLLAIFFRKEDGFWLAEIYRTGALLSGLGVVVLLGGLIGLGWPAIENLLITALILLLLADPGTHPLSTFFLGVVTAAIKMLLRWKNQPVFNPAAAGLFTASFFGVLTTWWGASFAPRLPFLNMSVAVLLTIPAGLYLVWLYKKIPTLVSVPLALIMVYFWLTGKLPLTTVFEGTFGFFLLIMATEPKTTPLIDWQEWIYGLLLGSLLAFLFVFRPVNEPYLAALLVLNGAFFIFRVAWLKHTLK